MEAVLIIGGIVAIVVGLCILTVEELEVGGIVAILGIIFLFVGCVIEACEDPEYYTDYKAKATQEEIIILETLNKNKYNLCSVRGGEIRKAIFDRSTKKPEDSKSFSDIKSVVLFYDNSLECSSKLTTVQELYKEVYNRELFEDESTIKPEQKVIVEDTEDIKPTPSQINEQVVEATVTLKEEALLSPVKVRELTTSAKECNRAKIELLDLTKDGRYLTIDDYESVTKLILDCENLKLQIELNE